MYMRNVLLLVICSVCFSSCIGIIASTTGLNDESPTITKIPIEGKEVYFIGMAHLAKKEFYESTTKTVASYKNKGFVFYVENVATEIDDTIALKKFRKLTSIDLKIKYSNVDNPYLVKLKDEYNLVDQPKYEKLGIDNYQKIDYNYVELIDFYEKKYGEIKLDSCDLNTSIKDKYGCKAYRLSDRKSFTKEIILAERNKLVVDKLKNSTDTKIIVIFGKKHLKGIKSLAND